MSTIGKRIQVAVFQKSKKGTSQCGDSYFYIETEDIFVCAIADGLGSGEFAKESSQVVIDIIKNNIHASEAEFIKRCNKQLLGKRGVVLGILKMDFASQNYTFSTIGNIGLMTVTMGNKKKRNIPDRGYLAGYQRAFKVIQERLEPGMNFIMFSDGVSDMELSQGGFLKADINESIKSFAHNNGEPRDDDTTIIAMRYGE